MSVWLFLPVLGPMVVYWSACAWLSGRLPRERRRAGDPRPVPALFDPLTSHRWGGVILTEPTRAYRPAVRAGFLIARTALVLMPVGVIVTGVLIGRLGG